MGLITKIFGTYSQRELKSIYPIADKIEALSDEGNPDPLLLQLILNCLFALSNDLYSQMHIKTAFEMRLMSLAGS